MNQLLNINAVFNMKITTVNRVNQPWNVRQVELIEVLNAIRTGYYNGQDLKAPTQAIQKEADHGKQNEMKKNNLPCALYNGTFSYKNEGGITSCSGVTAMDFDGFQSLEEMGYIWGRLTATPCVLAVFVTPSGKGLKALVWHDNLNPGHHREMYGQLLQKFQIQAGINDASCSDLSRGNYICYDPNIWIRQSDGVPYHFVHDPNYAPKYSGSSHISNASGISGSVDINALKQRLGGIMLGPSGKSDASIINIMNAHCKKSPKHWKKGNRKNAVFSFSSQLCRFGVKIGNALEYLKKSFMPAGLDERVIEYQAGRGYMYNEKDYGTERSWFDSYGNKGKKG